MSFNIALTGLNAVSSQLNTISNNIANVGTVGFKSSRTEFGSLYSGTQAMGVSVLGKTQSMSLGGSHFATGDKLNLAISEGGFFVTRNTNGDINYTRAGAFGKDRENYLIDASGQYLQGYPIDAAGNLQVGTVGDLRLQNGNLPAKATDKIDFVTNLDASKPVVSVTPFDPNNINSYTDTQTSPVYDSQGKQHSLTQYFVKTGDNTWETYYHVDNTQVAGPEPIEFDKGLVRVNGVIEQLNQRQGHAKEQIGRHESKDEKRWAHDFAGRVFEQGAGQGNDYVRMAQWVQCQVNVSRHRVVGLMG